MKGKPHTTESLNDTLSILTNGAIQNRPVALGAGDRITINSDVEVDSGGAMWGKFREMGILDTHDVFVAPFTSAWLIFGGRGLFLSLGNFSGVGGWMSLSKPTNSLLSGSV